VKLLLHFLFPEVLVESALGKSAGTNSNGGELQWDEQTRAGPV